MHALFDFKFRMQLSMNFILIRLSVDCKHNKVCSCFSASLSSFWYWVVLMFELLRDLTADEVLAMFVELDVSFSMFLSFFSSLVICLLVSVSTFSSSSSLHDSFIKRSHKNVCPFMQMSSILS